MTKKRDELADPHSCWSKARDDEDIFLLLERDEAAPATVRFWAEERVRLGLNHSGDWKIRSALEWAERVERSPRRSSSQEDA